MRCLIALVLWLGLVSAASAQTCSTSTPQYCGSPAANNVYLGGSIIGGSLSATTNASSGAVTANGQTAPASEWFAGQFAMPLTAFGAKLDGVTDDTTADLAAFAWANANHGALTFPATSGVSLISSTLALTASNTAVLCPSGPATEHDVSGVPDTGCWFKWNGASAQPYMMTVIPPSGSTANGNLQGIRIEGINFDGNNGLAAGALKLVSIRNSNIWAFAQHFNGGEVFTQDVVHSTGTNYGEPCDMQRNTLRLSTAQYGYTSISFANHAWINPSLGNGGCNVSLNNFYLTDNFGSSANNPSFFDEGGDNNTIDYYSYRVTGTGPSILFGIRNDSGNIYPANTEKVAHFSSNAAAYLAGQTSFPGTTTTGTVTSGSRTITAIAATTGIYTGSSVAGAYIPSGTLITAVNYAANTATMSNNASGNGTAESIAFGPCNTPLGCSFGISFDFIDEGNGSPTPTVEPGARLGGMKLSNGQQFFCSNPWFDVECFGAKGDDATDDTVAITQAFQFVMYNFQPAPVHFNNKVYKVTSDIIVDLGGNTQNLCSDGLKILTEGGADIDGSSITSTPTLELRATGASLGCDSLVIHDRLTVKGANASGPVLVLGNPNGLDSFIGAVIDYLAPQNYSSSAGASGAQINVFVASRIAINEGSERSTGGSTGYGVEMNGAYANILTLVNAPSWGTGKSLYLTGTTTGNTINFKGNYHAGTCLVIDNSGVTYNTFPGINFNGCATDINATAGSGNLFVNPLYAGTTGSNLTGLLKTSTTSVP